MKKVFLSVLPVVVVLMVWFVAGCDYTVPLVEKADLPIEDSFIGRWERKGTDGKIEQLLVLPMDQHEYMVSYPADTKNSMFARACLCVVDSRIFVQLKWFGTASVKLPDNDRVYQFAACSVSGDKLTVSLLNSDVVKKDLKSREELISAIEQNGNHPDLLRGKMVFTKVTRN